MKVSRPEFLRRFHDAFGNTDFDYEAHDGYLFCFRTVLESGEYFYADPFVIREPLALYYHMNNVDGVVIDKLVEQSADVVMLGYWSEFTGLKAFEPHTRISCSFIGLYLTEEDTE